MATQIKKRPVILGKSYKAFLENPLFWPKGVTEDDVLIHVDGAAYEGLLEEIADDAVVTIESGDVFENFLRLHSLQDHYESFAIEELKKEGELNHVEELAANMIFDEIHRFVTAAGLTPSSDEDAVAELGAAVHRYILKCRNRQVESVAH